MVCLDWTEGRTPLVLVRICTEEREALFVLGLDAEFMDEPVVRRLGFPDGRVEDVDRRDVLIVSE